MKSVDARLISSVLSVKTRITTSKGEDNSYEDNFYNAIRLFYHDGKVEWIWGGDPNPPENLVAEVESQDYESPDVWDNAVIVEGVRLETNAKSLLELAIRLATTGFVGKKRPELLEGMLRDPDCRSKFTDEDWNVLADYLGGKLNKKTGRPKKVEEAFYMVGHPISSERVAAHRVRAHMDERRKRRAPTRNILRQLIEELSEEERANPDAVAELLRTGRGL